MGYGMPSLFRSFIAVFVGFMVMVIVSKVVLTPIFVTTVGRQTAHLTVAYLVANAVFSFLAVLLGGLATTFVAERQPMRHTAALAAVVFVIGVLSYLQYAGPQPPSYRVAMLLVSPLGAVAGGALYARASRGRTI